MALNRTMLALCMATALLAGCKKEPAQADAAATEPAAEAPATTPPVASADDTAAPAAQPAAASFDINAIPVSDKPLGEWPYVTLPAGYAYDDADDLASRSKDLARVPVWTGGQLLWVEGKAFSDDIDNADGKTWSKFELRKNVQQAIEALGGVRLSERSYGESVWKANEKALEDFRQEFSDMQEAYWYDNDADTYVIRRADKAIWVVLQSGNDGGAVMVAEGPLPQAPAK